MYRIIFLADALNEIENASKWYAGRQKDLDNKFIENALVAIDRLQSDKIVYRAVYRGLSRVLVKRFPYVIYFRKDTEHKQIIIFGVLHTKQEQSNLDKRT